MLKQAATAAAAGGATIIAGGQTLGAQNRPAPADTAPPKDHGPDVAGRKFRALVSTGFGPNTSKVMDLTLLPIGGRMVAVKTETSQCCYTMCQRVLGTQDPPDPNGPQAGVLVNDPNAPVIQGHGGVGRVVAIGPEVMRVRVGDRVIVPVTPECGQCYQCLRGRADRCQFLAGQLAIPIAKMANGAEVVQAGNIGGLAEYMVAPEHSVIPIFTDADSADLSLLHCVGGCGLGTTMTLSPVEPGSNVAVFGLGPIGLSAVQGARIMGAGQVIGIDPIKVRRDLAMKLGATTTLDPNAFGEWELVRKVKELCKGPTDRYFAGGRYAVPNRAGVAGNIGPDFVIEAMGYDRFRPKVEASPDPTSIRQLQQMYQTVPGGGHFCTTGVGFPPRPPFPSRSISGTTGAGRIIRASTGAPTRCATSRGTSG